MQYNQEFMYKYKHIGILICASSCLPKFTHKKAQSDGVNSKKSDGLISAVGNTPLIYLKSISEATGCNIYGKAEFMNPTGITF